MAYIYKIVNKINNKIYIGQTRYSILHRWNQHLYSSFSKENRKEYNFLLHKAIRKYGKENFLIEAIEEIEEEYLNEREKYWIKHYQSCILNNGYGYNMTFGGEGSIKIDKDEVFKLWNEYCGSIEIAERLSSSTVTIKNILMNCKFYSKEEDFARNVGIPVYQYDSNGLLLNRYSSISSAAKTINVDSSLISKCCNQSRKSCKGYFWSYSPCETFSPQKLRTWKKYIIIQKDKKGNILATYPSLSAAGRAMNTIQPKGIKDCCEGKRAEMYGYIWSFGEEENNESSNN